MAKRRKTRKKSRVAGVDLPAKGTMRDMADKLWSITVKHDWAHRCAICKRTGEMNSHHIIPREHFKYRFDLRNGICLCRTCHVFCPKFSPHLNGKGFDKWLAKNHPSVNEWIDAGIEDGYDFDGTRNAFYFIDEIHKLRRTAEPDDVERICGVKFSAWLEAEDDPIG